MKKTQETEEKKRVIAEYSELNQTELHRSYGVKKKEGFLAHFNDRFASVLVIAFYALMIIICIIGAVSIMFMLGAIGIAVVVLSVVAFIWLKLLRVFRKRIKFLFKLKRQCKKLGYKIKFYRGFFKGLRFNKEGVDFIVDTGKKLWVVRFLPCKKYDTELIFNDKDTIIMKRDPMMMKGSVSHARGRYGGRYNFVGFDALTKQILGGKTKTKVINYSFTDKKEQLYRTSERALIINPVPYMIKKKEDDGATYETGTGERMWGYTVFSGSGFINTLRNESGK